MTTTLLDTWHPGDTINRHTHEIVADLLTRAAGDVSRTLAARRPARKSHSAPREASTAAPSGRAESVPERLRKLKNLHEEGLISTETYEQKQKDILDSY